jgi:hypothetical protein
MVDKKDSKFISLIVVLPLIVVVEISLQLHLSKFVSQGKKWQKVPSPSHSCFYNW